MAKKGRPFTYQSEEERPVTISLRLAHDLYDRLERYASRHRQSVSELVRDGIELRLAVEADPRWQTAQDHESYYDNTVLHELATPAHMLDDRIPFDDDYVPAPAPATVAVADMPYDNNTVIQEKETQAPAFDLEKYRLGKLCPRNHDYHGTGQSLVRKDKGDCRECDIEQKRARRQAKRQALEAPAD